MGEAEAKATQQPEVNADSKRKIAAIALAESYAGQEKDTDFSVVLFRSDCRLFSEKNPMKVLQNQWVWTMPDPSERLTGATRRGHTTAPKVQTPAQSSDMERPQRDVSL